MNITLTITKTFHSQVGAYFWVVNDGRTHVGYGYDASAISSLESSLESALNKLTRRQETGVNLTVKLPEGVTLSDAYKTQVTTKYTGDGTVASITFE